MGFELASVLEEAGLVVEEVRAEAVIHTARAHAKGHHSIGTIVRFMVPRIVAQGVATEAELDVATLDERLLEERTRANAVFISDMMFGAWARKPARDCAIIGCGEPALSLSLGFGFRVTGWPRCARFGDQHRPAPRSSWVEGFGGGKKKQPRIEARQAACLDNYWCRVSGVSGADKSVLHAR